MAASAHAATPSAYVYATSSEPDRPPVRGRRRRSARAARARPRSDAGSTSKGAVADARPALASTSSTRPRTTVSQYDDRRRRHADAAETPARWPTGATPFGLAVAPDGRHVYVANRATTTVSIYNVDARGRAHPGLDRRDRRRRRSDRAGARRLERVRHELLGERRSRSTTSPRTARSRPRPRATRPRPARAPVGIAVSADGASAYVADQLASGTIAQFSIAAEAATLAPSHAGPHRQPAARHRGRHRPASTSPTSPATRSRSTPPTSPDALRSSSPARSTRRRSPFGLALSPDGRSLVRRRLRRRSPSASTTSAGDGTLAVKADPAPAGFRPQSVVAVKPRDEQAPTIDLVTPADGAQYEQAAAIAVRLHVRRRGRLGPFVVHRRRARRRSRWTRPRRATHSFTVVASDGAGHDDHR